ncbi:MAG: carboxypeptidase regulatory-like domain-containing protein [Planctomycetes bacterium]|nr:carboxypeptidase regulatory-like domain-containing protein [Planctomycetota bacterium]MCB9934679.1 carboxypeptidase regulatory-like domain-containing protein [Planctomycetota bacterium]
MVDVAGRPVAGATVTVVGAVSTDKYKTKRASQALATTGPDGSFEGSYALSGTAVFDLKLNASLNGRESEELSLAVLAGDTYDGILITLPEGGSVSGQVVGAGFEPIVQALISIATPLSERRERLAPGWPFGRADVTGPDGRFTVANLQAGEYQLTVRAPGYTSAKVAVTVIAGVNTELPSPIVMTARTSITFKLTCSERQPSGRLTARFKLADGSKIEVTAEAALDGRALLEDVPEEATELAIEMPGFQPTTGVAIAPVREAHIDIGEIELLPALSEHQD